MSGGRWALVTGASGGLGREFAVLLAERGYNLVLAARSIERLELVSADLARFGVEVCIAKIDFGQCGGAMEFVETLRRKGIRPDVLINNAGQGLHGDCIDQPYAAIERMLHVNVASLTTLTHAIANDMAERGGGHVLLVTSLTSFMPSPTYAVYAATKAYVRHLGEALHIELAVLNVTVTVLSPGLMDTGFLAGSGQTPTRAMTRSMTPPAYVARIGLNALFAGRQSLVAGISNKLVAAASRFVPRGLQARIAAVVLNH
jgi:short-subunit dehydrogenase